MKIGSLCDYVTCDYDSGEMSQLTALVDAKEHVVDALYLSVHQGACLLGAWSLPWGSRWIRPHFMRVLPKNLLTQSPILHTQK